jgi:hypothetical protein
VAQDVRLGEDRLDAVAGGSVPSQDPARGLDPLVPGDGRGQGSGEDNAPPGSQRVFGVILVFGSRLRSSFRSSLRNTPSSIFRDTHSRRGQDCLAYASAEFPHGEAAGKFQPEPFGRTSQHGAQFQGQAGREFSGLERRGKSRRLSQGGVKEHPAARGPGGRLEDLAGKVAEPGKTQLPVGRSRMQPGQPGGLAPYAEGTCPLQSAKTQNEIPAEDVRRLAVGRQAGMRFVDTVFPDSRTIFADSRDASQGFHDHSGRDRNVLVLC